MTSKDPEYARLQNLMSKDSFQTLVLLNTLYGHRNRVLFLNNTKYLFRLYRENIFYTMIPAHLIIMSGVLVF